MCVISTSYVNLKFSFFQSVFFNLLFFPLFLTIDEVS